MTRTHGLTGTYTRGCRCNLCSYAHRERQRKACTRPLAADDPRHGTRSTYIGYGCPCDPCRSANAAYHRALRDARRTATATTTATVTATQTVTAPAVPTAP